MKTATPLGISSMLSLVVSTHESESSRSEESFLIYRGLSWRASANAKLPLKRTALGSGATRDLIKYEAERDVNGLIEEFVKWEKRLDAEAMKPGQEHC
jgi:hypothetical protein